MIINQTTMVSFIMPEEKKDALKFEAEHPDWDKFMTDVSVVYTKTVRKLEVDT